MTFPRFSADLRARRPTGEVSLVVLGSVGSTQSLARRIIEIHRSEGSRTPAVDLVAWEQTVGRGRGDRSWESPAGAGVWATVLRSVPRDQIQSLPVRLATALAESLRRHLGETVGIKWPNDLLLGDAKIGGLLIDVLGGSDERPSAAVGFGVNVSCSPLPTSTSFAAQGLEVDLAELASELLDAVSGAIARPVHDVERFRELLVHRPGDSLRCRLTAGDDPVEGRFVGLDPDGNLRLEIEGRTRTLPAAEILGATG